MNFLNDLPTAEWILNTAFQSTAVLFSGWLSLKLFKRKSAPLRSAAVIMFLLILAVIPLVNLTSFSSVSKTIKMSFPVKISSLAVPPAIDETPSQRGKKDAPISLTDFLAAQLTSRKTKVQSGSVWLTSINVFGLIWLTVTALLFFRFIFDTISLRKLRRGLTKADHPHIDKVVSEARSVFPRSVHAGVFGSSRVTSPIALGVFKPVILIPRTSFKKLSDSELRGVLIHEFSHIHHRDHLTGILQRLITLLNWWNPFVYALSSTLSRAREEISDNHVLCRNDSKEYAKCLIELVDGNSFLKRHPVATAMASPHIPLKERVKFILTKERNMDTQLKKSSLVWIVGVTLFFVMAIPGFRMTFAAEFQEEQSTVLPVEQAVSQEQSQSKEKKAQKADPVRATGEIKAPKLINKVEPIYPEEAKKEGIEGRVILEVTTDIKGHVQEIKTLRSIPALDEAAIEAIKQWRFEPMIIDGEPHGVVFTVTCQFKLDDQKDEGVVGGVAGGVQGGVAGGVSGGVAGGIGGGLENVDRETEESQAHVDTVTVSPRLIKKVDPTYPQEAIKAGVKGTVVLEVTIGQDGRVTDTRITQSIPELNNAAVEAVRQWIYEPYLIDGKPKSVQFTVTLKFHLK